MVCSIALFCELFAHHGDGDPAKGPLGYRTAKEVFGRVALEN
jgi:hypothetical protein